MAVIMLVDEDKSLRIPDSWENRGQEINCPVIPLVSGK